MNFKIVRQGHNFVINNGAKTVAYLYFKYARDESKYRNVELSYLHVNPSYRRQGIGTLLTKHFLKYFKKRGVIWASLWTGKDIEITKGYTIYKRLGFKQVALQRDYHTKGIGTRLFVKRLNKG
jgi:ribosomal protein S18 acetylase RimI-like enzyme